MFDRHNAYPSSLILYGQVGLKTPEIERHFFTKLRLPNGTHKTTYRHRLSDLNDTLLEYLPRDRPISLLDTAISSGISTVEWSDELRANGVQHRILGSDLCTEAWLTSWSTWLAVLSVADGRDPLLLEIGPLMVPVRSDRWLAKIVRPLFFPALRLVAVVGKRFGLADPNAPAQSKRWVHRSISLVSPELNQHADIKLVQDDVTMPKTFTEPFDAIRVANLLQRVYFDDETLIRIVEGLRDNLKNDGILAICRTMDDGTNHGTIFRRTNSGFVREAVLNDGAEIGDLVLSIDRSSVARRPARGPATHRGAPRLRP
jgi:hypothetical protein